MKTYEKLHERGQAYSVEVWENYELVGGLYGIDLGNIFLWREHVYKKKK